MVSWFFLIITYVIRSCLLIFRRCPRCLNNLFAYIKCKNGVYILFIFRCRRLRSCLDSQLMRISWLKVAHIFNWTILTLQSYFEFSLFGHSKHNTSIILNCNLSHFNFNLTVFIAKTIQQLLSTKGQRDYRNTNFNWLLFKFKWRKHERLLYILTSISGISLLNIAGGLIFLINTFLPKFYSIFIQFTVLLMKRFLDLQRILWQFLKNVNCFLIFVCTLWKDNYLYVLQ